MITAVAALAPTAAEQIARMALALLAGSGPPPDGAWA
jgi:hypothetical protein